LQVSPNAGMRALVSYRTARSNVESVSEPPRVLIDFDYEAAGIWKVPSRAEMNVPAPTEGGWSGYVRLCPAPPHPRPWSDRLPVSPLDALREWNDLGVRLVSLGEGQAQELDAFWARGGELVEAVQGELGPEYEVLYAVPEDAWTRVHLPWSSNREEGS